LCVPASASPLHPRVGQALTGDTAKYLLETLGVSQFTFVITKRLLIEVSKQMERLNTHRTLDGPLRERPEIFHAVCVDVAIGSTFLRIVISQRNPLRGNDVRFTELPLAPHPPV
jgi:hypothetical protein